MLPGPHCFPLDLVHLPFINFGELLILLWWGTLKCETINNLESWELIRNAWQEHGKPVADAIQFFPSSFHQPPRNPAEKISNRYKATETWLFPYNTTCCVLEKLLQACAWCLGPCAKTCPWC
jgi:hypothetical protein